MDKITAFFTSERIFQIIILVLFVLCVVALLGRLRGNSGTSNGGGSSSSNGQPSRLQSLIGGVSNLPAAIWSNVISGLPGILKFTAMWKAALVLFTIFMRQTWALEYTALWMPFGGELTGNLAMDTARVLLSITVVEGLVVLIWIGGVLLPGWMISVFMFITVVIVLISVANHEPAGSVLKRALDHDVATYEKWWQENNSTATPTPATPTQKAGRVGGK